MDEYTANRLAVAMEHIAEQHADHVALIRESIEMQKAHTAAMKAASDEADARVAKLIGLDEPDKRGLVPWRSQEAIRGEAHGRLVEIIEELAPFLSAEEQGDLAMFFERMLVELEAHDAEKPRTWLGISTEALLAELAYQTKKLDHVAGPRPEVVRRCAHVANYAAMLASNVRRLSDGE